MASIINVLTVLSRYSLLNFSQNISVKKNCIVLIENYLSLQLFFSLGLICDGCFFCFWDSVVIVIFFLELDQYTFFNVGAQFICSSHIVTRTKNAYKKEVNVKLWSEGNLGIIGDSVDRGKNRNACYRYFNRTLVQLKFGLGHR